MDGNKCIYCGKLMGNSTNKTINGKYVHKGCAEKLTNVMIEKEMKSDKDFNKRVIEDIEENKKRLKSYLKNRNIGFISMYLNILALVLNFFFMVLDYILAYSITALFIALIIHTILIMFVSFVLGMVWYGLRRDKFEIDLLKLKIKSYSDFLKASRLSNTSDLICPVCNRIYRKGDTVTLSKYNEEGCPRCSSKSENHNVFIKLDVLK